MTREEKLEDLKSYFQEQFPGRDIQVRPEDQNLMQPFWMDKPPTEYRRVSIPRAAIDDLFTAEIIAFLEAPNTKARWDGLDNEPLRVSYDVAGGLSLG